MDAYTSARTWKPDHGWFICTDRCYRYPSDVHSHRYRTACKIRCNLLAATRKCGKRGTGCSSTCRCCKIKRPENQIPCTSIITQCIYGNYRTCNLWCKLKILQTIYRRMYRWRMRNPLCFPCSPRCKRNRRNRYLRNPALPEPATSVRH